MSDPQPQPQPERETTKQDARLEPKANTTPDPRSDPPIDSPNTKRVEPPEGFDISNLGLFLFPDLPRGRLPKFPWLSDCSSKVCRARSRKRAAKTPSPPPGPRVEEVPKSTWLSDCSNMGWRSTKRVQTSSPPPGPRVEELSDSPSPGREEKGVDGGGDEESESDSEEVGKAKEKEGRNDAGKPVSKRLCPSGLFRMRSKEVKKAKTGDV